MSKPSKDFIIEKLIGEIALGATRGKTLAKFGTKWQISERTFDRHWKKATTEHQGRQEIINRELAAQELQAATDAKKLAIMDIQARKEYLTKIAKGDITVPNTQVRWDPTQKKFVTIPINEPPSTAVRIAAISELNKMDGAHAPLKVTPTNLTGTKTLRIGYGPKKEQ